MRTWCPRFSKRWRTDAFPRRSSGRPRLSSTRGSRSFTMSLADALARRLHRFASVRAVGKRLFRGRTIRQPFHGGLICLDAVEHSWAWTGAVRLDSWDRPLQDRLLALSRECRSMIDVGGNVGVMTLSVAMRNPTIRIVTVQPNA